MWAVDTLSEHVCCVAVTVKMTEQVEQGICIMFCVRLEHSSTETTGMIQRPQPWATGAWQLHHNNALAHASCLVQSFFCETLNHPGDSVPYSPYFAPCDFWLFPKIKSPLEGKRFQTVNEIQENMMGHLRVTGRTV